MENAVVRGTARHPTRIGKGAEVRVNAVVHVNSTVASGATVPIAWVAVGDPAEVLPPNEHERIWAIQEGLDFPGTVFGLEREPADELMLRLTERYARGLAAHLQDRILGSD